MKKLILLAAVVCCCNLCFAQDEEDTGGFQKSKLFAGGNLGLSFSRYTFVNISPQIGYRFNRFVAAGLGVNLIYSSQKDQDVYGNDLSKSSQWITGLNLFGRFYPTQNILLQVQPEANYRFGKIKFYQPFEETYKLNAEIIPSFLVGGGYVVPSDRGAFVATVMFDVLQRDGSPYGNRPIVNFGYNINL